MLVKLLALVQIALRYFSYSEFLNLVRVEKYRMLGVTFSGSVSIRPGVIIKGCKNVTIGSGVFIGEGTQIVAYGGEVSIGENSLIADNVYMSTRNHRFRLKNKSIRSQGYKCADIVIGADVWLAHGVVVLAGSNLERGAVVGAGIVIRKAVSEYEVVTAVGRSRRE